VNKVFSSSQIFAYEAIEGLHDAFFGTISGHTTESHLFVGGMERVKDCRRNGWP
jgi:hypothetical protein